MKFRSDIDGYVTGVRFYKAAANTGTHVGTLWSQTGEPLAHGDVLRRVELRRWQEALFSEPVAVTANTTYVASYSRRAATTRPTTTPSPRGHRHRAAARAAGRRRRRQRCLRVRHRHVPDHDLRRHELLGRSGVHRLCSATDITPPTVAATTPGDATRSTSRRAAQPTVTFSEAVDDTQPSSLTMRDAADTRSTGPSPTARRPGPRPSPRRRRSRSTPSYTATLSPSRPARQPDRGAGHVVVHHHRDPARHHAAHRDRDLAARRCHRRRRRSRPCSRPSRSRCRPGRSRSPSATPPTRVGRRDHDATTPSLAPRRSPRRRGSRPARCTPRPSRAREDAAGNTHDRRRRWSFTTTTAASGCPCSIWSAGATPARRVRERHRRRVELGVKFRSDTDG